MEQLIKITTVPIEYELKINNARTERKSSTAEIEISRTKGGLQMRSRPIKVNIDTYDARNSVVPTTKVSIEQSASKGKQAAYSATAQFASEGKILLRAKIGAGSETINNIIADRVAQPTGDFKLAFLPTTGPNIEWEAPELSIQYEMDKLNFDAKINNGTIEFIPGSIDLTVTQHPDVHIEYTGEPIYVPASAAEFFSGEVIDVKA